MKSPKVRSSFAVTLLLALVVPILAACGGPAAVAQPSPQIIRETVVVQGPTSPPEVIRETVVVRETAEVPTAAPAEPTTEAPAGGTDTEATGAFTTPHPILSDVKVRQAIAYCTNRPELIQSVYPFLSEEQQTKQLMDTNVPKDHWASSTEGVTVYNFDPEKGKALLEEAGWTGEDGAIRTNAAGEELNLKFLTTNAQFRQTWATVLEQQLADNCGIQIVRTHAPASFVFGATSGLQRRDFELGAFAWVGEADPDVSTLYACNQIPTPANNWEGQNYMGWCNETASNAVLAGGNTLDREARKAAYATFQQEFSKDMVSLPLFQRTEAEAANINLQNWKPDATEYVTANAGEWSLSDGGDTLVIGFTQEPASLFTLVESAAVAAQAADLLSFRAATTYSYDYQAGALTQVPTIENGGATNADVEVSEGDIVWSTAGEAITLTDGVEVRNSAGETVTFDGSPLTMKQLTVNFEYVDGLKWEDGTPITQADFELATRINCDPDSGATSFLICESRDNIEYTSDKAHTITYKPGVQWAEYSIYALGAYPAHQVLSDGRKLADVPASEYATLLEIAEDPLSAGPYKLISWEKGQRMTFEANENYYKGAPAIKTVIIQFFEDTNQAVAQLLTGDVDILEKATLGAGPEVQTVLEAAAAGQIQAETLASPTWEHMDMNLFMR